jgi:hypothetical protein
MIFLHFLRKRGMLHEASTRRRQAGHDHVIPRFAPSPGRAIPQSIGVAHFDHQIDYWRDYIGTAATARQSISRKDSYINPWILKECAAEEGGAGPFLIFQPQ